QEVSRWTAGEVVVADFLPTLLEALARSGCPYDAYAATPSFAGGLPVDGEWMHVQGCNVTLVRSGGPVEVVAERVGAFTRRHEVGSGVDGVRFPIERGWSVLECRVGGRELRFANTHTEAYDAAVRDAQRDELLSLLGPGGPRVVVGDFNATPDQVGMPAGLVDAWAAAGEGAGPTWGQTAGLANADSALRERIDYVFVGDARVLGCRVVGDGQGERTDPSGLWPSDHAAVVTELDLTR
ncbi:MAG: endonuclease/exonuclease/phosphatase family protein, partial [Nocardioidaceae bacterium]